MLLLWLRAQLLRRPGASSALLAGLMLVGLLLGAALAWQRGLAASISSGADPQVGLVLALGSEESAERSELDPAILPALQGQLTGVPISPELLHMGDVRVGGAPLRTVLRGVDPVVHAVRPAAPSELVAGAWLGSRLAQRQGAGAGDHLELLGVRLPVAGILSPELGFAGDEVWVPRDWLMRTTERDSFSTLAVRADPDRIATALLTRYDLAATVVPETVYLQRYGDSLAPLRAVVWLTAGLLVAAALLGCTTVALALAEARARELGTLRAIGLGRWRILRWLGGEGVLLGLLAAVLILPLLVLIDGRVVAIGPVSLRVGIDLRILASACAGAIIGGLLVVLPAASRSLRAAVPVLHSS
ncbi:MAG: FtsX-like permease family protein [Planctomycetota bacterium]